MKITTFIKSILATALSITALFCFKANAQDYVSPTTPPLTGRSPGVKVKLISGDGPTKTYVLVFAKGDEVMSGLKEFAVKYHVTSAHFNAIGDASSVKFGWYDISKKMFKVLRIDEFAEITSLVGDITLYNNNPVVHAHISMATQDGIVHGGHLFEAFISPTLQLMMTIEPASLFKKLDPETGILVIDPDLQK
jgi:predicted DNA-binding protein with PD1-like motif